MLGKRTVFNQDSALKISEKMLWEIAWEGSMSSISTHLLSAILPESTAHKSSIWHTHLRIVSAAVMFLYFHHYTGLVNLVSL